MTTTATHTILTDDDHTGRAHIVPTDWADTITANGEDPAEWTAFDAAATFDDELGTVHVEWDEGETFETFEAAVNAAGFIITGPAHLGDYPATRA